MNRVLSSRVGVPFILTHDGYVVPLTPQNQGEVTALLVEDPELWQTVLMEFGIGVAGILDSSEIKDASTVDQFVNELNPLLLLNEFATPAYVLANAMREAQNLLQQVNR